MLPGTQGGVLSQGIQRASYHKDSLGKRTFDPMARSCLVAVALLAAVVFATGAQPALKAILALASAVHLLQSRSHSFIQSLFWPFKCHDVHTCAVLRCAPMIYFN